MRLRWKDGREEVSFGRLEKRRREEKVEGERRRRRRRRGGGRESVRGYMLRDWVRGRDGWEGEVGRCRRGVGFFEMATVLFGGR